MSTRELAERLGVDARLLFVVIGVVTFTLMAVLFGVPGAHAEVCSSTTVSAALDPGNKNANITLSNSNLTASTASQGVSAYSQSGKTAGKWYWEIHIDQQNAGANGILGAGTGTTSTYVGGTATSWGYATITGVKINNGSQASLGPAIAVGDVLMVAVDLDAHKIWWGRNGTWFGSGNPATGANAAFTNLSGTVFPGVGTGTAGANTQTWTMNFGATAFAYTVPSGFNSGWSTTTASCAGQYVCSAGTATSCASWVELSADASGSASVSTFDEVGLTGGAAGLSFAFGLGAVLVFVALGWSSGAVTRVLSNILGGRH